MPGIEHMIFEKGKKKQQLSCLYKLLYTEFQNILPGISTSVRLGEEGTKQFTFQDCSNVF